MPERAEVGAGKLFRSVVEGEDDGAEAEPLSTAQLISELLYGDKSLEEVAGYDDSFIENVLWLRRDSRGNLRRDDLPDWVHVDDDGQRIILNPVPFGKMFRQVKAIQGLDPIAAEFEWSRYRDENPILKKMGAS